MQCTCPKCSTKIYFETEDLFKLKRPILECPGCKGKMLIKPQKAKCGKCFKPFGFYGFSLNKDRLVNCPNCKTLNRVA